MHISKEGDAYLLKLMVQGAHYILGPFGADSDLRRWALRLAERGEMQRNEASLPWREKLAAPLHGLWVSGEVCEPLRNSEQAVRAVA